MYRDMYAWIQGRGGWTAVRKASRGKIFGASFTPVQSSIMDALQPREAPCRLFKRKIAPFICTFANFLIALLLFCRVSRFVGEIDCFGISVSHTVGKTYVLLRMPLSEPLLKKMEGFSSPAILDVKSSVIFEEGFLVLPNLKA